MSFMLQIEHVHFDKECTSFKGIQLPAYIEKRTDNSLFVWVGSSFTEAVVEGMTLAHPGISTPIFGGVCEAALQCSKRLSTCFSTPLILLLPSSLPPPPNCTMSEEEFYLAIERSLKRKLSSL